MGYEWIYIGKASINYGKKLFTHQISFSVTCSAENTCHVGRVSLATA